MRPKNAGVTRTIPTREFANPLSISRSSGVPRITSFSLNQTVTLRDSSRSCSSLAAPCLSSQAWQRKTSLRVGRDASLLDSLADRRECGHLSRRVQHGRICSRPLRPCAAAGPAAAAPRRLYYSPTNSRMGTTRSCCGCIHYSGDDHSYHGTQDSPLPRSLNDGHILALCI